MQEFLRSPYLVIAGDESLRNGDKKFPIFVSFWHTMSRSPWWERLRVCSMKDKTAKTQAERFYEMIVHVIRFLFGEEERMRSDAAANANGGGHHNIRGSIRVGGWRSSWAREAGGEVVGWWVDEGRSLLLKVKYSL